MNKYSILSKADQKKLKKVKGPIIIFGAGGFIGVNLMSTILNYRKDVIGVSQDYKKNWRLKSAKIDHKYLRNGDLNEIDKIEKLIKKIKPKTIFNLAAYGAYSKQREYKRIYKTNINSTIDLLEILKREGFNAYIHAGSQSEYGVNSKAPAEKSELIPNSHYAVSKTTNYYTVKYYGKVENLPVAHLRLYSAFGPWEEPDRLIPVLISKARIGKFPPLVDPQISRDFIYISDIVSAFICVASIMNKDIFGEAFNIATGRKTTIKKLALIVKKIENLKTSPRFGNMEKRDWDLKDWYGNIKKANKVLKWHPKVDLEDGLKLTSQWQESVDYNNAKWNFTR